MPHPKVFRAPMRSRDDNVPTGIAVDRALEYGVCGIGGRLERPPASLSAALTQTDAIFGERGARRLERFASAAIGSFAWTRDGYELFWLCQISGEWRYDTDPGAWAVDLTHVRSCKWIPSPIPYDEVPASVHHSFARGGRNWQQIRAEDASAATVRVWSHHRPGAA